MHLLSEYLEYFAPDFQLHPDISTKQENLNTKQVRAGSSRVCHVLLSLYQVNGPDSRNIERSGLEQVSALATKRPLTRWGMKHPERFHVIFRFDSR